VRSMETLDSVAPTPNPPTCPECGCNRLFKDGLRHLADGSAVQRWLCSNCCYRFTQRRPSQNALRWSINSSDDIVSNRQVCDLLTEESKNLTEVARQEPAQREGTPDPASIKGKILELCIHLKRQGYSEETIRVNRIALKVLMDRGANLFDENSVKDVIVKQPWSDNRRRNVINAYDQFVKFNKLSWEKPRCTVTQKFPFVPTEQEIDCLISAAPKKLSTFLQLLKETAMRRGEAKRLEWINIDSERNTITLNEPEKHSNPRIWKVTPQLIAQLNTLPKNGSRVFGDCRMDSLKSAFLHLRKKQAFKLQNPRLRNIGLHTLRHWKATTLYHRTKDALYVRDFLGHKSIKNTEIYINIERQMFTDCADDEFTVKVTSKPEEATKYLEAGFEWVGIKDNLIFLRKRK
jgi:integrase